MEKGQLGVGVVFRAIAGGKIFEMQQLSEGGRLVVASEDGKEIFTSTMDPKVITRIGRELTELLDASQSKATETKNLESFGGNECLYLEHLCHRVQKRCPVAVDAAVGYMCTTERKFQFNRSRAKLARRLKHVKLSKNQEEAMLQTILVRLRAGDIDEQFIEQIRFALWLDRDKTRACAQELLHAEKKYIARYAERTLRLGVSPFPKPDRNN